MPSKNSALCINNLKVIFKAITDEAKDTAREWAEDTMKISQDNFCPYKTGKLKGTGTVKTVTGTTREFAVRLSYGDGINYAIPVHERSHGKNHYLSTPFNLRIDSLLADLQNRCGEVLR